MNNFTRDLIRKEDEVYQKICDTLKHLKNAQFYVERSPRIGQYTPDFAILDSQGYYQIVIEVKYSLENTAIRHRSCDMVKDFMECLAAPYGYVIDGQKGYFIDKAEETEINDFYGHLKNLLDKDSYSDKIGISAENLLDLKKQLSDVLEETMKDRKTASMVKFIRSLKETDIIHNNISFSFTEEKEREFMRVLLGQYKKSYLCRYTSMAGLFRTLDCQKHSVVGLVGMNDKGETDYVESYMNKHNYNKRPSNKLNSLFILSCCDEDKQDDLTMFRLYGDDSRGVCLKYAIKRKGNIQKGYFIAPVSYAVDEDNHPQLDLFISMSNVVSFRHYDAWLHFFKSSDYKVEEEVRLLYEGKATNWINISSYGIICPIMEIKNNSFPLRMDKIVLGPNCPEKEVNKSQIMAMTKDKGISIKYNVDISKRSSYRVGNSKS